MKSILITLICIFVFASSFGQSNPLDKKLEKVYEYIKKDKVDDAQEYMEELLEKNPGYGEGWDLLAKIMYKQYEKSTATDNIFSGANFTVTTKDENGKEIKDDSMANALKEMLASIKPSDAAYERFIFTMRKGTAFSQDAVESAVMLRNIKIDVNVDSNLSKKALNYYNQAEEQFAEKNYNKAAMLYQRAINEQPDFYKASLYLGDCYYAIGEYTEAIKAFKAARDKFPNMLEPRKYLVDAYAKMHLYNNAVDEAIQAIMVYPDNSMVMKLDNAAYFSKQNYMIEWTARGVLPNNYIDTTDDSGSSDSITAKGPWVYYKAAYAKAAPYCNKKGLLRSSTLTTSRYLEVYSWEEMLKNSNDPSLEEARKMQKLNYLDCYALVTCFHIDLYPQFLDFIASNKERVMAYYKAFIKNQ